MGSLEFGKSPEEIKVDVPNRVMPNRAEYRRLLKTGKDEQGHEAMEQDVKDLRRATIGDLKELAKSFGAEVNKANQGLKDYVDIVSTNNNYALLKLVDFLEAEGILKEGAGNRFDEYMAKIAQEEIEKAKKAAEEAKPEEKPNIITLTDIKEKHSEKTEN